MDLANQRRDFLHKLTTTMVTQHTAICTEDLSVRGLARTKLATSVQDAGMGILLWQLAYKGQWYGTHVVSVDRFYPSTQLCHDCGFKNADLTLVDRTWVCPACGVRHDRDINAALNIRDEGLRLLAVGYPAIAQRSRLWTGRKTGTCRQARVKQESHRPNAVGVSSR